MADCSYFRCMQERRFVKRELQKWYKNMVYIVGLERIAEELMGRRKWKQYQESLTQSHATDLLVKQSPSIAIEEQQETSNKQQKNCENNKTGIKTEILDIKEENKLMTTEDVSEKLESSNNNKSTEIEDEEIKDERETKERSEPVDWKPQDKCYFCVDGKLLKVNESGELAIETGPVQPEAELNKHIIESEDSSDDSDTIQKNNQTSSIQKNLEALFKTIGLDPNNMTSLESMAAQIAAYQRLQTPELNQMNPFYPNLFYNFPQISPTTTPDRTSSPLVKTPTSVEVPSPSPGQTMGEQPLDLSAKPSGSMVFKAKPRISTVPGRRSYTEEELNNALQDILSGKLGTRRAAVLYGIPRSTLRNKVYKLAIEQKRELLADHPPIAVLEEEDDKDSEEPDDDKDVLKMGNSGDQLQTYLKFLQKSSENLKQEQHHKDSPSPLGMPPSSWSIDPATWLQSLIIANGLQGLGTFPSLMMQQSSSSSSSKEELPEFLRKLLTQPQDAKSGHHEEKEGRNSNNGMPNQIDPIMMMNLLQSKNLLHKSRSSSTPDMDLDGASDDSSAILKIPSIVPKTLFGSGATSSASSTQSKNGDISHSTPSTSPQIAGLSISPQGGAQTSALANHLAIRSPSLMRQRSESGSPPATAKFNLNDVIRQSISKNFQTSVFDDSKHSTPLHVDPMDSYQKRPVISVIKNLGGTDLTKFGTNPNVNQMQQGQLSPNNTGTGGKGTRPKRGKYRNYDRDSLVEAVKAVQRGEMSVHRAGSYYGVPHSTLEYKVKERHLMRPRKREPKPQPGLDSTTSSAAVSAIKRDFPAMDKTKTNSKAPPLKPPYTSPNGMKMQPFMDPASMAQLQIQQQLLFPHHSAFPGLSALEFATRSSSQNHSSPFSSNADFFAAQKMLQQIQEHQQQQQFKPPMNGSESSSKQMESLYDPVSTNGGSFLDGIIRSTLDKKPGGGTLFEHLLKKGSMPNSSGASDNDDDLKSSNSLKRPGSPMNFSQRPDIKRERSSPSPNHEHDADDYVSKLRENLTTTMIKEELNNGSLNNSDDVNSS